MHNSIFYGYTGVTKVKRTNFIMMNMKNTGLSCVPDKISKQGERRGFPVSSLLYYMGTIVRQYNTQWEYQTYILCKGVDGVRMEHSKMYIGMYSRIKKLK